MLFTGKGDNGKTTLFGCSQECSKNSAIAEALGTVDEINSLLGLCKVKAQEINLSYKNNEKKIAEELETIQQNLFIVQAELAGAEKTISEEKLREAEEIVNRIEKELPPIKTFFVSGGTELGALFDFARTVSRRAERRVIAAEETGHKLGEWSRAYMNRLSSILYAYARLTNTKSGITELPPQYK